MSGVGFASDSSGRRIERAVFPELARDPSRPEASLPAHARRRAHQIVREAERDAQALVEAARQKASAMAAEGYRDGRLQGQAEALAEMRGQIQQLAAALETAITRIRCLEEDFRARAIEVVVELALAVAERICRDRFRQDPAAILPTVQEALTLLPEAGEIVVRMHPDQLATLRGYRDGPLGRLESEWNLRLLPDPSMEVGDCLVETPASLVDATLAEQLDEARRRLRGLPP